MATVHVNTSAAIAFLELLRSIDDGDDVFLLRSSDACANDPLQCYNDDLHGLFGEHVSQRYKDYFNRLAEAFQKAEGAAPEEDIPDGEVLEMLARALAVVKRRVMPEG